MKFIFYTGLFWGLATLGALAGAGAVDTARMNAGDWVFLCVVLVCGYGAIGGAAGMAARTVVRRKLGSGPLAAGLVLFCFLGFEILWRLGAMSPALPLASWPRLGLMAAGLAAAAGAASLFIRIVRAVRPAALEFEDRFLLLPLLCAAACAAALTASGIAGPLSYHAFSRSRGKSGAETLPNIVLITMDSLSVRAMGSYGFGNPDNTFRLTSFDPVNEPFEYWSPATPQMDHLASEGVVLDRMVTPVPLTTPSHAAMLTGLSPRALGVINNAVPLDSRRRTLAELLKSKGYATGAFVNTKLCASKVNMQQGFDTMTLGGRNDGPAFRALGQSALPGAILLFRDKIRRWRGRDDEGQASVDSAIHWIASLKGRRPFFLWLHLYNAHTPYDPPPRFRKRFGVSGVPPWTGETNKDIFRKQKKLTDAQWRRMLGLYHGDVAMADELTGVLVDELFNRGELDRTALMITADHGEMLYERDRYIGHEARLYEPIVRVPFIMRYPEKIAPGTRRNQLTSTLDIFPTVLGLAGIESDKQFPGMDLMPLIIAPPLSGGGHDFLVSETFFPESEQDMAALVHDDLKLLDIPSQRERRLYFLSAHIQYLESTEDFYGNLQLLNEIAQMEDQLSAWRKTAGPRPQPPGDVKKLMRRLKSLGYVR